MIEIKHNSICLRWNFYSYIQLTRGRFWLQLRTVKKFSEQRISWCVVRGKIQKCGRNLLRHFADGRTDGAYLGGRRCVGRVHSVVATPQRWRVEPVTCLAKSRNGPKITILGPLRLFDVYWPRLTAKRIAPVVSISWASCYLNILVLVLVSVNEYKSF